MDMQYNTLTWLILFSYLFLLALSLGIRSVAIAIHVISNVIFFVIHAKLYSYQNLSLSIILKVFLKFGQFQRQYSYKVYSY